MYPGKFIKLKSAIFRRNSIFNTGSYDQIEKIKFHFDTITQGAVPGVRNQKF
jgi:hypothetical protein